jgi:hypothetical protein
MMHEAKGENKAAADWLPQGARDHPRAPRAIRSAVCPGVCRTRCQAAGSARSAGVVVSRLDRRSAGRWSKLFLPIPSGLSMTGTACYAGNMTGDLIVLALVIFMEQSTSTNVRPEKLTDERSRFYRERVFGIRLRFAIAVATVLAVIRCLCDNQNKSSDVTISRDTKHEPRPLERGEGARRSASARPLSCN